MAPKSWTVHYLNKYPGARVDSSDSHLEVRDASGKLRVRLEKNGAGQWVCVSEEHGAIDRHDLSPIPKDARAHKLYSAGGRDRIGRAEEHAQRSQAAIKYLKNGKVQSIEELKAEEEAKAAAAQKASVEAAAKEAAAASQKAAEAAAKEAAAESQASA